MKTILQYIVKLLGNNLFELISDIIGLFKEFFGYKKNAEINKKEENEQKKKENFKKKVEDIIDNGSLNDLLNAKK